MRYRVWPKTGWSVSCVGFGTDDLEEGMSSRFRSMVRAVGHHGVNLVQVDADHVAQRQVDQDAAALSDIIPAGNRAQQGALAAADSRLWEVSALRALTESTGYGLPRAGLVVTVHTKLPTVADANTIPAALNAAAAKAAAAVAGVGADVWMIEVPASPDQFTAAHWAWFFASVESSAAKGSPAPYYGISCPRLDDTGHRLGDILKSYTRKQQPLTRCVAVETLLNPARHQMHNGPWIGDIAAEHGLALLASRPLDSRVDGKLVRFVDPDPCNVSDEKLAHDVTEAGAAAVFLETKLAEVIEQVRVARGWTTTSPEYLQFTSHLDTHPAHHMSHLLHMYISPAEFVLHWNRQLYAEATAIVKTLGAHEETTAWSNAYRAALWDYSQKVRVMLERGIAPKINSVVANLTTRVPAVAKVPSTSAKFMSLQVSAGVDSILTESSNALPVNFVTVDKQLAREAWQKLLS